MRASKMKQAENMRYAKIERLTDLLCRKDHTVFDDIIGDDIDKPFKVGKRITVEGERIVIKNKAYDCLDLKRVTINTEGSFSVYDRSGKKMCGWAELNSSVENIELFCIWIRKHGIPADVVSGKGERTVQWVIFSVVLAVIVLIRVLRLFL